MKRVVIVGAGVSGLATAYHLGRIANACALPLEITILERESRPGGRVWTERIDGFQIESGANGFLDTKRSTLDLCGQLDLGSELIVARPEAKDRFIFWRDRLHKLPTGPLELLRSGLLSWRGKMRLLAEAMVPRQRELVEESVHQFACRRLGREAAEVLVDAMVTGIQAGDATVLSVVAAFPRMIELERSYGSLLRAMPKVGRQRRAEAEARGEPSSGAGGKLWSLRRGMGQIVENLAASTGAQLLQGVAVRYITPDAQGGWIVQADGADRWRCDAVVLACPSFVQAEILESVDTDLAALVSQVRYNSVSVVALGFCRADISRPLAGFGYLSPQRSRRDVLGVLWSSSIFEHRAPADSLLVQAMCGGWNRSDIITWDDDTLVRAVLGELRQSMDLTATPRLVRIFRWPRAIPQYQLGHTSLVMAIEHRRRGHPGLYLTGNSYRGISVNDCTEEAIRCAKEVSVNLEWTEH